jgi:hypothetical protein
MAFSVALVFAFIIKLLSGFGLAALLVLAGVLLLRNIKIHRNREKVSEELELLDLKRVKDADYAVSISFEHSGRFLEVIRKNLSLCFDGILTQDRRLLKQLRRQTSKIQKWSNIIVANVFKTMRILEHEQVKQAGKYAYVISALQEISESLRDLILRCHVHTANHHAGLLPVQKKELQQVRKYVEAILEDTARIFLKTETISFRDAAAHYVNLKQLLEELDQHQIERIRTSLSKTRLSILFYGINNACLKISEQTLQLLTIFEETFSPPTRSQPPDV